jgi:hypothetical protein
MARGSSVLPSIAGLQPYEWLTLVGIVVGPIAAVLISLWVEQRRKERDQKIIILRLLLTTRHLVADAGYSAAINLIPIEFAGNRDVQTAYREYIELAFTKRTPETAADLNAKTAIKQTRLIHAVAQSMGYKNIAETDIQTTAYAAEGWIERENTLIASQQAMVRVANALWLQLRVMLGLELNDLEKRAVGMLPPNTEEKS